MKLIAWVVSGWNPGVSGRMGVVILTILGGGGFRVPLVHQALLADADPGRVSELRLFDLDASRLAAVAAVCAEQAATHPHPLRISTHTDLAEAVHGSDFIFSAIRVAGLAGRECDETIPLRHGIIGQETVGAGGIAYALRTLPVVAQIAEVIRREAPEAWVINFTNPAGVVTESLRSVLGERVVGICDSPVGLARRTKWAAGLVPDAAAEIDYVGLNHLGWLRAVRVAGVDVLPGLLADATRIESFEEGRLFGADWIQTLGAIPNEYLHHYYFTREALAADQRAAQSRAQVISEQQRAFYGVENPQAAGALARWDEVRLARERTYMASNREAAGAFEREAADLAGGGYDQVALAIVHAIAHDRPATLIVNTANAGRLAELDDDAVIEAPCLIDGSGVHPLPTAPLPGYGVGLVQQVKATERLTLAAASSGRRRDAWLAMASHPLVDSVAVARLVLDELIDAVPQLGYLR